MAAAQEGGSTLRTSSIYLANRTVPTQPKRKSTAAAAFSHQRFRCASPMNFPRAVYDQNNGRAAGSVPDGQPELQKAGGTR